MIEGSLTDEDRMDTETHDESEQEKRFDTIVRNYLIYFTILIALYRLAYTIISVFSKRREIPTSSKIVARRLDEDEDMLVYRISTWLCAFTLAISIGAASLLPLSILTNEVLGDNNNCSSSSCNSAATVDSSSSSSSLLSTSSSSSVSYQNSPGHTSSITWFINGLWSYVFLFSNISLFVLLPFAYFFTESEGFSGSKRGIWARLRETFVLLILVSILVLSMTYLVSCLFVGIGCHLGTLPIFSIWQYLPFLYSCISFMGVLLLLLCTPRGISHLFTLFNQMDTIQSRNLYYATAMIILLILTGSSMLLVLENTLKLLAGIKSLPMTPMSSTIVQIKSLSKMGPFGATIEIVLVLYLWCASLVGLYNLPGFFCLRPKKQNTSFNQIIGNCAILCLLSSALPLIARTLGITNFDLLADFGRVEWLGNFYVVLLYNLVFLGTTTALLLIQHPRKLYFTFTSVSNHINEDIKQK